MLGDTAWADENFSRHWGSGSRFLAAVDIGHTPAEPGAISARGKGEYAFNKAVAEKLLAELKMRGVPAFIINPRGRPISLKGRVRAAVEGRAGAFISIHHDSVQPQYLKPWTYRGQTRLYCDKFKGYSLFLSADNGGYGQALRWARATGKRLIQAGFRPTLHHAEPIPGENRPLIDANLGIYRFDGLAVLKISPMPALLVECGIIVNRTEELILETDEFRSRFVGALADGVEEVFIGHR